MLAKINADVQWQQKTLYLGILALEHSNTLKSSTGVSNISYIYNLIGSCSMFLVYNVYHNVPALIFKVERPSPSSLFTLLFSCYNFIVKLLFVNKWRSVSIFVYRWITVSSHTVAVRTEPERKWFQTLKMSYQYKSKIS